jgi:cell division protease FtsH
MRPGAGALMDTRLVRIGNLPRRSDQPPPLWRLEGAPAGHGWGQTKGKRPWYRRNSMWLVVIALLAVNWFVASRIHHKEHSAKVPYTYFREQVQRGNVSDVASTSQTIQGAFRRPVDPPGGGADAVSKFRTVRPEFADDHLLDLLVRHGVQVKAAEQSAPPLLITLLVSFGPTLLLVGLVFSVAKGLVGGGIGGLGRSRAKRYDSADHRTTFDDIAGIEDAEEELLEIVDFLRDPERYRRLGAAVPRGVLLSGPPGTGKTLLARAVAGEADVPFFSLSASEFIEMVVGVGASRVRDLFNQAKEVAPAIIFIDELDAIGRVRGAGNVSGHDEREQTLNQILTEMDGFSGSEGVIVLAATNRPEILDPALLRPGRFDRRVTVNPPDQAGRQRILWVHTRGVPLDDDVRLAKIAASATGMVGAELKNLVNEAALLAARREHERVNNADFADAFEKILLGAQRHITLEPDERRRTAYHEAGHALLGMLVPGADPVRKVSIVPRGRALGVTVQSSVTDRYGYGVAYLRGRIVGALGGRAAEELVFGEVTTGAEADLEQVTMIGRQMVGRWGMSREVGLVSVLPGGPDDYLPTGASGVSEATRQLVDLEVRRIIDECYSTAMELLSKNRQRLDVLASALLEHETLDEVDAYRAAGFTTEIASTNGDKPEHPHPEASPHG